MAGAECEPVPGVNTFLFTDIEGSTRLWEEHPDAMRVALAHHDDLLRACIEAHGGQVFKTVGDAFCATFPEPRGALDAVLAAQTWLTALDLRLAGDGRVPLRVRMALHTGAAEARGGDYFGPALNRVARLLALGHGGQVLLSTATAELVRDRLPGGASLLSLGEYRLKDLGRPEGIFQLRHTDLPADFLPLRATNPPPPRHNLPQAVTSFVGREKELREIGLRLEQHRLLTLTGAGGCGKTRLALELAALRVEAYPDGVWLVELGALADPAYVVEAVAEALGVREEGGQPLLRVLLDHLRTRSLLLVLDNCEHLLDACARLVDEILRRSSGVRVFATSREGLGVSGEATSRVPSLSLPEADASLTPTELAASEAARLFVARAEQADAGFRLTPENGATVASLCRRLDGIPLALELAAARLRSLSLEELQARLDQRFRLLTGGSRTALPRQQTLRSLIDWSYDLLNAEERALLSRLAVFAGGWALAAAEEVCAGPEEEVLDHLTSLVDKSLVLAEAQGRETRYRMLETIRQYATERLQDRGEAAQIRSHHRDHYLALAETAARTMLGPAQRYWQERLRREHENLRAALEWSLADPDSGDAALRLAGALDYFWLMGSHLREGRDWTARALAAPTPTTPLVRAQALEGAMYFAFFQGDLAEAGGLAAASLAAAREAGDRWQISAGLFQVGLVAVHGGSTEVAAACADEGMALARAADDPWLIGRHLVVLGLAAWMRGDFARARRLLEETLEVSRTLQDEWHIGVTLANVAYVVRLDGDPPRARELHREGLRLCRDLGDRRGITWHLVGLAALEADAGNAEGAAHLLGAAEALIQALGAPLPLPQQRERERVEELTRTRLGDAAFTAALHRGRTLPLEAVVAPVLEPSDG